MRDGGGFEGGVEIERRAAHFGRVSGNGVMFGLPSLLPEPSVYRLTSEGSGRLVGTFSTWLDAPAVFFRAWAEGRQLREDSGGAPVAVGRDGGAAGGGG